jgi:hypothetical protein
VIAGTLHHPNIFIGLIQDKSRITNYVVGKNLNELLHDTGYTPSRKKE